MKVYYHRKENVKIGKEGGAPPYGRTPLRPTLPAGASPPQRPLAYCSTKIFLIFKNCLNISNILSTGTDYLHTKLTRFL